MYIAKPIWAKNVYEWAKLFEESRNDIQAENKPNWITMAKTTAMVDSLKALF